MAVRIQTEQQGRLEATVAEFFDRGMDGAWYSKRHPQTRRVVVQGGFYRIERRSGLHLPWEVVIESLVSDFDPIAFRHWMQRQSSAP